MTTLVLFTASAVVYFQVTTHERERLVASKAMAAEMVANVVAGDLTASIDFDDQVDVVSRLDALKADPEILGAAVWRAGGGEPFASWSRAGHAPLAAPDTASVGNTTRSAEEVDATSRVVAKSGEPSATVKIAFSLARENDAYRQTNRLAFFLTSCLVLIVAALLIGISRLQIVRPLARLADAVRRFERGERRARVAVSSNDEIGSLARAFNAMADTVELRQQEVEAAEARFRMLVETMPDAVVLCRGEKITYANPSFIRLVGRQAAQILGCDLRAVLPAHRGQRSSLRPTSGRVLREEHWDLDGKTLIVEVRKCVFALEGEVHAMLIARNVTQTRRMQAQLMQSDKLAAIGTLAAGVAHEINTPIQFVSDNVRFIDDATRELTGVLAKYRGGANADDAERDADLPFVLENLPAALEASLDGLSRIASIVRSLKVFAHPDQPQMAPADINQAIESTLVVAKHEHKYVADVVTELAELPLVTCNAGDVNQALLNIVVNAAHAIADVVKDSGKRGTITIKSRREDDMVVITISDTGKGIPEDIRDRIWEPFFTTKGVGKGTGQGLAIARAIVVDKHGGRIGFESATGEGTTFRIELPIAGKASDAPSSEAA